MEYGKLIELLNEYEDLSDAEECEKWYIDEYDRISEGGRRSQGTNNWICSKRFGFIKRLVDNNKIDRDRCECRQLYNALKRSKDDHGDKNFSRCERLLMLLSISDTPIDDLISYLR